MTDWYDTPGTPGPPGSRQADDGDSIEAKALDLAQRLIERADLLIAMTDHDHAWPALPRDPDIHVINKIDRGKARRHEGTEARSGAADPTPIAISALHGTGLSVLVTAVRQHLVPDSDLTHPGPWLFDDRLADQR